MPADAHIQKTHLAISEELVGTIEALETGKSARVSLTTLPRMKADEQGLIHGGFTFGLADYAAMVAVNEPSVVLLSSSVKFLKPVIIGDRLTALARIQLIEGRKQKVWCDVFNQDQQKVLEGEFLCLIPNQPILGK
jgi:uncharacterized protein (TIGR00369 family)